MEIAGVVLGAVPVIIYALESYGKAAEILNDTHKWLDTIQEIQDIIEVQVEMLRVTLQSLDIEWTHQSGIPITEIETALKECKPLKWDMFLRIIQRMDALLTEMAKDLCPDVKGPPNWTIIEASRMQWEWHRVRRSFRRTRREKISSKLVFWNDALRNCGLRRSDALTEQGQRGVDEIRQRFDDKVIATTRRNAASLHKAINASWGCSCVELHSGNILLDWHGVRRPQSNSFSLAFPPPGVPQLQHISTDQGWRFVAVCVQEISPVTITSTAPESSPIVQSTNQFLDPDKKRTRFFDLIRPRSPGKATSALVSQPAPSGRESSVASGRGSTFGLTKPLPRLCPLSQCHGSAQTPQGIIPVPDSDLLEIHFLPHEQQPDSFGGSISLQTLLSGSVSKRIKARSNMTRKERFGIAAALTWGTMHLCDSAWLNESIEDKVIGVTFKEHGGVHNPRIFGHPFLNVIFSRSQVMPDQTIQTKENELMAKQIQNKTLYSLAIRLMELGLDKDFGQLRKEYDEEFSPESGGVSVSDLEIARFFLHSLGRDCGINYQIAVEYCLRFLFAGSPENCFQDVRFRRTYFDLVIAPVQNVYNAIDQYQYQAQGP